MAGGKLISTGVEFPDATTQTTSGLPLTGGTMTGTIAGFTSTGIDDNATSNSLTLTDSAYTFTSINSAPILKHETTHGSGIPLFDLKGAASTQIRYLDELGAVQTRIDMGDSGTTSFVDAASNVTRMQIDSSGNVLVGTTDSLPYNNSAGTSADFGFAVNKAFGFTSASAYNNTALLLNRTSTDGDIIQFRKDGGTVGSIGSYSSLLAIGNGDVGFVFSAGGDSIIPHNMATNTLRDNAVDLGQSSARWDDIYATNGTIQTSDRNEKQDIEELNTAEQNVAVACKGLMRKFRWQDAVAEKGDDARIHFGIIAQDLQDAFAAEGLDAGRYAMFISGTWYEKEVEVPAVEAVEAVEATYDDEGAELTPAVEAVEAKDAYTRTDTEDEPTVGYTERTRLGVRYPELLAFIISAM